jgi:hypothetical protein
MTFFFVIYSASCSGMREHVFDIIENNKCHLHHAYMCTVITFSKNHETDNENWSVTVITIVPCICLTSPYLYSLESGWPSYTPRHRVPILVAFYDMHGLQWDYSFPRSPHGEMLYPTNMENLTETRYSKPERKA